MPHETKYSAPLRLVLTLAVAAFVAELLIMLLLSVVPPLSVPIRALIDSILLAIFVSPVLYLFAYRPLVVHISRQQQSSKNLAESEEKYRTLVESANDAIFLADATSGVILDANRQAERLIGLSRDEIIGMHHTQLHPKDEGDRYRSYFEKSVRGEETTDEMEPMYVCNKAGDIIAVEISASVFELGTRQVILGIFHDISQRKKAEESLRESEMRFASFMDNLPGIAFIKDKETRHLFVNTGFLELFDRTSEEVQDKTNQDLFPPEIATGLDRNDASILSNGEAQTYHEIIPVGDEERHYLSVKFPMPNIHGRTQLVGGIAIDVTERMLAEQALRESEEKFRLLYENAPVAYQSLDELGYILEVNQAWLDTFGYTRGETIQRHISEFMFPESRAVLDENFPQFKAQGEISGPEFNFKRKDGSNVIVQIEGKIVT